MPLIIKKENNHCCDLVNRFDHDRYLTILYAPEQKRDALFALYAFNYEISRIREVVSEPMLGEIRLQWWREAIADIYQGNCRSHEVMPSLAAAVAENELPQDLLMAVIEGRAQDLYDENPDDMPALEDYLSLTAGNLSCLAVHILGQRDIDDLARKLGIAWGYVGLIRAVTYHISLRKSYIPVDLMEKYNIKGKFLSQDYPENMKSVLHELCQYAERHLDHISENKKRIGPEIRSVFLLSALARSYIKTIKKSDYNVFRLEEKADAFSRQWRLLTSALFNRI
ncbi:MAG: hypothetical protein COB49_09310 [Alphaproteobacteria bacterium]|nr:MAG: hypothetical protein COB49_09310 [Alphaproteobacteria bacterium]